MDPNAPSRDDPMDTDPAHYFDNAPFSFNRLPFRHRVPPSPLPASSFASDYLPSPGDTEYSWEYKHRNYAKKYAAYKQSMNAALAFAQVLSPVPFPAAVPPEPTRALWEATTERASQVSFSSVECNADFEGEALTPQSYVAEFASEAYDADSDREALTFQADDSDSDSDSGYGSDSDSGYGSDSVSGSDFDGFDGAVPLTPQEDDSDSDSDGGVLFTPQEDDSNSDSDGTAILIPQEDDSNSDSDGTAILIPQEDDSDSDSKGTAILTPQEDGYDSDSDGEVFLTALEYNADSDSNEEATTQQGDFGYARPVKRSPFSKIIVAEPPGGYQGLRLCNCRRE